jgi:hypothetical protein
MLARRFDPPPPSFESRWPSVALTTIRRPSLSHPPALNPRLPQPNHRPTVRETIQQHPTTPRLPYSSARNVILALRAAQPNALIAVFRRFGALEIQPYTICLPRTRPRKDKTRSKPTILRQPPLQSIALTESGLLAGRATSKHSLDERSRSGNHPARMDNGCRNTSRGSHRALIRCRRG